MSMKSNHTKQSIEAELIEAQEVGYNAYVKQAGSKQAVRFNDVRINNDELQIKLVSYQGSVWQKVLPSDSIYIQ